jgi:hypothetical protein
VKPDWRAESLGWFDGQGRLVGVGLVLFRPLPKLKQYLAYLPEGPVIDWAAPDLEQWLKPMLAYLKSQGAFSVKMGPPSSPAAGVRRRSRLRSPTRRPGGCGMPRPPRTSRGLSMSLTGFCLCGYGDIIVAGHRSGLAVTPRRA